MHAGWSSGARARACVVCELLRARVRGQSVSGNVQRTRAWRSARRMHGCVRPARAHAWEAMHLVVGVACRVLADAVVRAVVRGRQQQQKTQAWLRVARAGRAASRCSTPLLALLAACGAGARGTHQSNVCTSHLGARQQTAAAGAAAAPAAGLSAPFSSLVQRHARPANADAQLGACLPRALGLRDSLRHVERVPLKAVVACARQPAGRAVSSRSSRSQQPAAAAGRPTTGSMA